MRGRWLVLIVGLASLGCGDGSSGPAAGADGCADCVAQGDVEGGADVEGEADTAAVDIASAEDAAAEDAAAEDAPDAGEPEGDAQEEADPGAPPPDVAEGADSGADAEDPGVPDTCLPQESCNGADDDCDGETDEGFDLGAACDGEDQDLCADGVIACSGEATTCTDDGESHVEVCGNEVDDDCDGTTDVVADVDGDGFGACEGDCCEVAGEGCPDPALVGPKAAEVLGNGVDDDCDGAVDEQNLVCEEGTVSKEVMDPMQAAYAMELCHMAEGPFDWGVLSATWVLPDGTPVPQAALAEYHLGHGALPGFGPNVAPQKGDYTLALSSGTAREPTDPDYRDVGGFDKMYTSGHPAGFPKEAPSCPNVSTGQPHDGVALELKLRVPYNAHGFSFDHKFYTYEWPGFVCSQFNDFFVVLVSPTPQGLADGNVAYDDQGNPMSVNNAQIDACGCVDGPPCQAGGKQYACSLGTTELEGTGFTAFGQPHGATGWLTTTVPVKPGDQIVVRLAVYDSGDGYLDATALVDNWSWISDPDVLPKTVVKADPVKPASGEPPPP